LNFALKSKLRRYPKVVAQYSSVLAPIAVDSVLKIMDPERPEMVDLKVGWSLPVYTPLCCPSSYNSFSSSSPLVGSTSAAFVTEITQSVSQKVLT
jgi:hypothetical protein